MVKAAVAKLRTRSHKVRALKLIKKLRKTNREQRLRIQCQNIQLREFRIIREALVESYNELYEKHQAVMKVLHADPPAGTTASFKSSLEVVNG